MKLDLRTSDRLLLIVWAVIALLFVLNVFNYLGLIELSPPLSHLLLAAVIVFAVIFALGVLTIQVIERRKYFFTLAKIFGVNGHVSRLSGRLKFKYEHTPFEVYFRKIMETDFLCVKATLPESLNLGLQILGGAVPLEVSVSRKHYGKAYVSSPFPLAIEARAVNEGKTRKMLEDTAVINLLSELTRYASEKGDFFLIEDNHITYYSYDPAALSRHLLERIDRLSTEMIRFRCQKLNCSLVSRADLLLSVIILILIALTTALVVYRITADF